MSVPPRSFIGIFDSGVGGLSVLKAIRQQLPGEALLYLADQAHVPYGPRPLEEVRFFSEAITRFLLDQGAKLIVVACNAASAAALHDLRQKFPEVPFVGMEPAVKPAAERTQSGVVGVLATPATFQGALYASVVERFARDVTLLQHTCPGLVAQIEAGNLDAPETRRILEDALQPMLARGIDTVVLGCTHYPFVIPLIQDIVGPGVRVIDPAPAVARQVGRVLEAMGQLASTQGGVGRIVNPTLSGGGLLNRHTTSEVRFYTSGDPHGLRNLLPRLIGVSAEVRHLHWAGDQVFL